MILTQRRHAAKTQRQYIVNFLCVFAAWRLCVIFSKAALAAGAALEFADHLHVLFREALIREIIHGRQLAFDQNG